MNKGRLFVGSCFSLVSTSVAFAVVGAIMGALKTEFILSNEQVGYIGGAALWGFTISIFVLGPLVDALKMRNLMFFAWACHLAGPLIMIFASGDAAQMVKERLFSHESVSSADASTTGMQKTVPMLARTTLGLETSVFLSHTITALAPTESAVLIMEPRFPGFSIDSATRTSEHGDGISSSVFLIDGATASIPSLFSLYANFANT